MSLFNSSLWLYLEPATRVGRHSRYQQSILVFDMNMKMSARSGLCFNTVFIFQILFVIARQPPGWQPAYPGSAPGHRPTRLPHNKRSGYSP